MKQKLFFVLAAGVVLASCNSSGDKKETNTGDTTAAMNHDSMHHDMDTTHTTVSALPAVPQGAKVYFKNLKEGQTISLPFKIIICIFNDGSNSFFSRGNIERF